MDSFDNVAFAMLERRIRRELEGDAQYQGLLRGILSSNDWEAFVRAKGIIFAYDEVLKFMDEIVRKINEPTRRAG
jgi:hypothetical protein